MITVNRSLAKQPISVVIDALRWLAAALVFNSHLRSLLLVDYNPLIHTSLGIRAYYFVAGLGYQAVVVFFVLSGYLVGGEVLRELTNGRFDWRHYLIRRASRLYAVYVVALGLGLILDLAGLYGAGPAGLYTGGIQFPTLSYAVSEWLDWATLLGNLCFLQRIVVPTFGSNEPLWSLANEAWYYLLFPLLVWPVFRHSASAWSRLGIALLAGIAMFITRSAILPWFTVWLLGLLPVYLRVQIPLWLASVGLLGLLTAIRFNLLDSLSPWGQDMTLGVGVVIVLLAIASTQPDAPTPVFASVHRGLARFSFTLYLVHWPILLFTAGALQRLGLDCIRQPFSWTQIAVACALTVITYSACFLVARYTEFRTPELRRWLENRLRTTTQ